MTTLAYVMLALAIGFVIVGGLFLWGLYLLAQEDKHGQP